MLSLMRALLVGLESDLQRSLSLSLPARSCSVEVARTTTEALAFLSTARHYQLVVVGDAFPMLGRLQKAAPGASVVWARANIALSEAVDAAKAGAFDVWSGPPSAARLDAVLTPHDQAEPPPHLPDMVIESPAMQSLLTLLRRVAASDAAVLLTGETGTGKGKLARWLHETSGRSAAPFVVVDCAGLASSLAENELFGHARGAFTGAEREAAGRFEAADGGTLFLDEIGELSQGSQQKLLRFLEEGEVERLGEVRPRRVDARVLAATHRDLRELVAAGRFREDLLYRLEVVDVRVPPLRDRPQDILPLARVFLAAAGGRSARFSAEAERKLLDYRWPGNVRELRNAVERALVLRAPPTPGAANELDADLLPARLFEPSVQMGPAGAEALDLEVAEKDRILEALKRYPKLDDAAAALGIDPSTLWRKRKRLGLT